MTEKEQPSFVAVLPAAGASSRLGQSKHLVNLGGTETGEAVIARAVRRAWAAGASRVVVVTGDSHTEIARALRSLEATLIPNANWRVGMGSSIAVAARWLLAEARTVDACLIQLADQVLVTPEHLKALLAAFSALGRPDGVAATTAPAANAGASVTQPPAVFGRAWFPALAELAPEAGAKGLLSLAAHLALVPHGAAAFDLDTPADLERLGRTIVQPACRM